MQPETLNPAYVSISSDTIAVRDQTDEKCMLTSRAQNIYILEPSNNVVCPLMLQGV
jgi:hypothetical protein